MRWAPSLCFLLVQALAGPRREAASADEDLADISFIADEVAGGHMVDDGDHGGSLFSDDGHLHYSKLANCTHGRHLLLISLLESPHQPCWRPRCGGDIQLFLPPSLQQRTQPAPSSDMILRDIPDPQGGVITRDSIRKAFNQHQQLLLLPDITSSFDSNKTVISGAVVDLVTSQPDFHSLFSYLVTIKAFLPTNIFVDSVFTIIHKREDVGFIIPSSIDVFPEDYLPSELLDFVRSSESDVDSANQSYFSSANQSYFSSANQSYFSSANQSYKSDVDSANQSFKEPRSSRIKRQAIARGRWWRPRETVIRWNRPGSTTIPSWEEESRLWYWREDPVMNANHYYWHRVLSNFEAGRGSASYSSRIHRRGEMFFYMHRQMVARYNCERLSHGMQPVRAYGPREWSQPLVPGYTPRLGGEYGSRPSGARLSTASVWELNGYLAQIRNAIRVRQIQLPGGDVWLTYRLGDLHNQGHNLIGGMNRWGALGVMAQHQTAVRDPAFFRWHKFIDDVFMEYKTSLGEYRDADLSFPGVRVTRVSVQTDRSHRTNTLFTFTDHGASIRLNSLDFRSTGQGTRILYSRLNHMDYTLNLTVLAERRTQGMVRVFLIPAGISLPVQTDVVQTTIELDRFHVFLRAGNNTITRGDQESPFVARRPESLHTLQQRLLSGHISEDQFNWAGCGWPSEMHLPRGNREGMPFRLVVMVSSLLPQDRARPDTNTNWTWCGVRGRAFPDSRPMGFPFDRTVPGGNWRNLLKLRNGARRSNWGVVDVKIQHDPVGIGRTG